MAEEPPTQQLLFRSCEGFITERVSTAQFRTGPLTSEALTAAESNGTVECDDESFARYSKDGKRVSVINTTKKVVNVYDAQEEKLQLTIEGDFHEAYFSPLGSFLVTFSRRVVKGVPNLLVFSMVDGSQVNGYHLKEINKETWPVLRWSNDEQVLAHLVTNQINFFDGTNPASNIGKLHAKDLYSFSLADNGRAVAVFVPDKKGHPASACIYELAKTADDFTVNPKPTAAKTFFRATAAKFAWSPLSNAVLVTATTDMDKTGESYYGESHLHLLYTDSQCLTVPFGGNKGPVHDAQWSPQGNDFVVIQGFQPAKITLFNASNCTAVREFGTLARNTILFSPHGRFLCIGGFGNLAGEMDFWEKNKFKQLGTCQDMAGATTFEWTPDSRNFITAALFPRRRVDEGIKVWTYYGEKVYEQKIPKLTQVAIRPALPEVYPNKPMSPRLSDRRIQKEIADKMEASRPKAYVPPHMRGKGGGGGGMDAIKASKMNTGPRKLKAAQADLDPEVMAAHEAAKAEKNAEKNKKRRERRKEQAAKQGNEEAAKQNEEQSAKDAKRAAEQAEIAARNAGLGADELLKKKLKKLQKQERGMQKIAQSKKDGKKLDAAQKTKLEGHPAMLEEICKIEEQLKNL